VKPVISSSLYYKIALILGVTFVSTSVRPVSSSNS
jgi:hypothetical protein